MHGTLAAARDDYGRWVILQHPNETLEHISENIRNTFVAIAKHMQHLETLATYV
jgi:hypothetical protein